MKNISDQITGDDIPVAVRDYLEAAVNEMEVPYDGSRSRFRVTFEVEITEIDTEIKTLTIDQVW